MKMWVKICGNTTAEDALHAAASGADALGFIFARSPRQLSYAQVAAITAKLPAGPERVGVFDSQDSQEIAHNALEAALTTVQLHGGFNAVLLESLASSRARSLHVIQTLHWAVGTTSQTNQVQAAQLLTELRTVAEISKRLARPIRVLVDSRLGKLSGGTGVAFAWNAASRGFTAAKELGLNMIAAGGLTPDNVSEAIAHLHPWGVDVASGVERSPGQKDPARVAEFIANARGRKRSHQSGL